MIRLRWIVNILRKDYLEHFEELMWGLVIGAVFAKLARDAPGDWKPLGLGFAGGIAGFYSAIILLAGERERNTLELLVGLPVRPLYVILGKFVSVYSFVLLMINLSGVPFLDLHLVLRLNAEALFVATFSMACSLLSDHKLMPLFPMLAFALICAKESTLTAMQAYAPQLATYAAIATPIIALACVAVFWNDHRVG